MKFHTVLPVVRQYIILYNQIMDLLDKAIEFAVKKHSGQVRKLAGSPYILHPLEVAAIASTITVDPETLAACVLHDTIEDTETTYEEIEENFGRRVALLVMTETEDKRVNLPEWATWKLRKQETLAILKNTKDISVKIMWLSDKLSNIRSFYREKCVNNVNIFSHLNQKDPAQQGWYYKCIISYLSDLKDTAAYKEFVFLVSKVFEGVEINEDTED